MDLNKSYEKWEESKSDKDLNNLIISAEGLLNKLCNRFSFLAPHLFEDVKQEGRIAIFDSTRTFDRDKGYKFSTYAITSVKNRVYKFIYSNLSIIHLPKDISKIVADLSKMIAHNLEYKYINKYINENDYKYALEIYKALKHDNIIEDNNILDNKNINYDMITDIIKIFERMTDIEMERVYKTILGLSIKEWGEPSSGNRSYFKSQNRLIFAELEDYA